MRVVFASDVEATKLVGAPSREVKSGGSSGSVFVAAGIAGSGAVFGTRRIDEHAPRLTATKAAKNDESRRWILSTVRRVTMTPNERSPRDKMIAPESKDRRNSDAEKQTK